VTLGFAELADGQRVTVAEGSPVSSSAEDGNRQMRGGGKRRQ
jgi:hypothetical protein